MNTITSDDFIEMIRDWQADNSPEYDDLIIGDPYLDSEIWYADAEDDTGLYLLMDYRGNVIINYVCGL